VYTTSSSSIVKASSSASLMHESILLVEVEDVGGKERGFPANVGEGFLHVLLNEPPPIDWLDSVHCSEHGIRHCNTEPFRFLWIKDG
jgi:hypothetical protein